MVFEAKGKNIYIDDFVIKFEKDNITLTLDLPTEAMFNKIFSLATIDRNKEKESMDRIDEVIVMILNKNKDGITVDAGFVNKNFDTPEKPAFLTAYFKWIKDIKNLPNSQSPTIQ